jgi:CYTH domain-containing protein
MDKSYRTEFVRTFLINALPEPLTPASSHLQLFDNYITNTRIRLRSIRVPETKEWIHLLQQRFPSLPGEAAMLKIAEMYLNEAEYEQFKIFEGNEIRKNRYFHEFDGRIFTFDVYLGNLWGLNIARSEFNDQNEMAEFSPPSFAVFDVSNDPFFLGDSLVFKNFDDIRAEVQTIATDKLDETVTMPE